MTEDNARELHELTMTGLIFALINAHQRLIAAYQNPALPVSIEIVSPDFGDVVEVGALASELMEAGAMLHEMRGAMDEAAYELLKSATCHWLAGASGVTMHGIDVREWIGIAADFSIGQAAADLDAFEKRAAQATPAAG